jgi:hypothetical protein
MQKLALTLTATAIGLGMSVLAAAAQTQSLGANVLRAQSQNFTPIFKQVACKDKKTDSLERCAQGWQWNGRLRRCSRCY